ncbi:MAG: ATP-grasp domain-containing protein, partial [Lentisphaeraceae bacterium]|nr:ATP-grasp domain-containing protein [Lentisphaeraceae bacterium]
MQIQRILIANRGEVALRIINACRLLGIESVLAISPVDKGALVDQQADKCHYFTSSELSETYLNAHVMVDIAIKMKCDAIHPGYGFLSENAGFARLCHSKKIIFIGPGADIIEMMGDKVCARQKIAEIGIPLLAAVTAHNDEDLLKAAQQMKLPLLIKAAAGGGGRGMRIVESFDDLELAIKAASQEALSAFGNGRVYVERYLPECRHIEVQVLSDSQGKHLHLGERECSIQRRHQKVVEESPAYKLDNNLRQNLHQAAVRIAEEVNYCNAGTVEFICSGNEFFFLEMNTRLQVEHAVTEEVFGIDIVRRQIEVAEGKALDLEQENIAARGHAIEVRLYAEDPYNNYMPASGTVKFVGECHLAAVRLETGYSANCEVPTEYDCMLAKIIA